MQQQTEKIQTNSMIEAAGDTIYRSRAKLINYYYYSYYKN